MLHRTISILLLISLIAGCSPVKYTFDVNENYSFESIKTFNFHPDIKKIRNMNPANIEFAKQIIKSDLEQKGFSLSEEPDVLVNIFGFSFVAINEHETKSDNDGLVQSGAGYMIRPTETADMVDGNLFIDIYDASTKKKIWEAKAESEISGSNAQNQKIIDEAIKTMLTNFPPVKK